MATLSRIIRFLDVVITFVLVLGAICSGNMLQAVLFLVSGALLYWAMNPDPTIGTSLLGVLAAVLIWNVAFFGGGWMRGIDLNPFDNQTAAPAAPVAAKEDPAPAEKEETSSEEEKCVWPYVEQDGPGCVLAPLPTNQSSNTDNTQPGNSCPQARDLGPWAPSNGVGEDFEITASDAPESNRGSAGVVVGLWFPHGQTPWGDKEITTFIPRGLSVTVINGAGRGWDYESVCPQDVVQAELTQHMRDRNGDTNYSDFVDIDELIRLGLVVVRFDRR